MTGRPPALDTAALNPPFALARWRVHGGTAPFTILAVWTSTSLVRDEAWPAWGPPSAQIDGASQAVSAAPG